MTYVICPTMDGHTALLEVLCISCQTRDALRVKPNTSTAGITHHTKMDIFSRLVFLICLVYWLKSSYRFYTSSIQPSELQTSVLNILPDVLKNLPSKNGTQLRRSFVPLRPSFLSLHEP